MRALVEHRDDLVETRTQTVNRLHVLLTHLTPVGAPRGLTADRAADVLRRIRPCEPAVRTLRSLAVDLVAAICQLDRRITKAATAIAFLAPAAVNSTAACTPWPSPRSPKPPRDATTPTKTSRGQEPPRSVALPYWCIAFAGGPRLAVAPRSCRGMATLQSHRSQFEYCHPRYAEALNRRYGHARVRSEQ